MSKTPEEEETARIRAEVAQEIEAEESGGAPVVDAEPGDHGESKHQAAELIVDPWEGVNPALKKVFDQMTQKVSTLSAAEIRLKQAEQRIGAITNELHAARKAAETAKEAPTPAQMAAAVESDEQWEILKKDFPEWADALDGRMSKKLNTSIAQLRTELKQPDSGHTKGMTAEEIELRLLTFAKPKWREEVASPEWKEWLALQPPEKQVLVQSDRAEDARDLLDAFEQSKKNTKTASEIAADRQKRIKTAVLPEGGKAAPLKSEADMSTTELRASIGKEIFAES